MHQKSITKYRSRQEEPAPLFWRTSIVLRRVVDLCSHLIISLKDDSLQGFSTIYLLNGGGYRGLYKVVYVLAVFQVMQVIPSGG